MKEFIEYVDTIQGEEVTIKRYGLSNGKGLYDKYNPKTGQVKASRKKLKAQPADARLNALEKLLKSAKDHEDDPATIQRIENAIKKRMREICGG